MKARLRSRLDALIKSYKSLQSRAENAIHIRPSIKRKQLIVGDIKRLLTTYRTLIILDNTKMPTKLYLYMKKRYADIMYIKSFKNKLLLRALKELDMPNVEEFSKYLNSPTVAIFTNFNPFEAKLLLDRVAVPHKIKPGDRIEYEIVVPPMRTELKPGPIMSLFGKLKIPIQVRDGVIWIMREATIAKPGDIATPELVSLFDKLGIEPKFLKPKILVAYERGLVIPGENLVVDIDSVKNEVLEAVKKAFGLATELVVPEPGIIRVAIMKAYTRSCTIAAELGIMSRETAPIVLAFALRKAYALASVISQKAPELSSMLPHVLGQAPGMTVQTGVEVKEEKTREEKEEREGISEEQLAEGLTALFG